MQSGEKKISTETQDVTSKHSVSPGILISVAIIFLLCQRQRRQCYMILTERHRHLIQSRFSHVCAERTARKQRLHQKDFFFRNDLQLPCDINCSIFFRPVDKKKLLSLLKIFFKSQFLIPPFSLSLCSQFEG